MSSIWIPARVALSLLEAENGHAARYAICERAHAGLLGAKAKLLLVENNRHEDFPIPTEFWWAEGQSALDQDWIAGDFSTWLEERIHLRAFGVQFDFAGLSDMLPPDKSASAARSLSVLGSADWMSAQVALRFMYEDAGISPTSAGSVLLDHAKLGFVPARALLMQRSISGGDRWDSSTREWDVPEWFWENFTKAGFSTQDWSRGLFKGRGRDLKENCIMLLTGVHFLKSALMPLAPTIESSAPEISPNKGGRPRKEFWDEMWCAIWGQVYRGDLTPKNQADIERAMLAWIEGRNETASESTVKPLARKMFAEMER